MARFSVRTLSHSIRTYVVEADSYVDAKEIVRDELEDNGYIEDSDTIKFVDIEESEEDVQ